MFCAFLSLLMLCGGIGVLVVLGWQRIASHLNNTPGAKQYFAENVVMPLLLGGQEPETEDEPEGEREHWPGGESDPAHG